MWTSDILVCTTWNVFFPSRERLHGDSAASWMDADPTPDGPATGRIDAVSVYFVKGPRRFDNAPPMCIAYAHLPAAWTPSFSFLPQNA